MTKNKKTPKLNSPKKKKILKVIKKATKFQLAQTLSYTELICLEYKLKNNL